MICIFMILGKGLVSDENASCVPNAIAFLYTTLVVKVYDYVELERKLKV